MPHGGVVTATVLRAAATHFGTTLAKQNQPHTITLHAEFLRRTRAGPATLTVRDAKLGRQTSTVHVALAQDGRDEVVVYVTNANMAAERGLSLRTGWAPDPPLPPAPRDLARLAAEGEDADWVVLRNMPHAERRKAVSRVLMHVPRAGQARPGVVDEWVRLASGERFPMEGIGFVADVWPQMIEGLMRQQQGAAGNKSEDQSWLWYPTLVLNLDIKKVLPPEGVEWLHVRVHLKQIKNGRYDYEVIVYDDTGDMVALSHHVAMVLDGRRNTGARGAGESKI